MWDRNAPKREMDRFAMARALVSLICGIASVVLSFLPLAGVLLGFVAIGAGGPVKEDKKAVIGMLCGLVGIVLAAVIAASSLETQVVVN